MDRLEFSVRPRDGKAATKRLVPVEAWKKELETEKLRDDIVQIVVMTTRPLGCVVLELMRDAGGEWLVHRKGVDPLEPPSEDHACTCEEGS